MRCKLTAMAAPPIPLNELLGNLSLAADLAVGVGEEGGLRTALLAVAIGRRLGLAGAQLSDVYYAGLLRYLGCTGFAHETAQAGGGDDIALLQTFEDLEPTRPAAIARRAVTRLGRGQPAVKRARTVAQFLADPKMGERLAAAHCAQASALAQEIGLSAAVGRSLGELYERFDGLGAPNRLAGDAISLTAKIVHLANVVEVYDRLGSEDDVLATVRRRRGQHLAPDVCDAFTKSAREILVTVSGESVWDDFCAAAPQPVHTVAADGFGVIARAFAQFVDLKSPYTLGHSTGLAELADRAATRLRFADVDRERLRLAALLHDLGRLSVANGILRDEVTKGRLDREVVGAVLDVAGQRSSPAEPAWPAGLTDREVQVIALVARGRSNKEIATALEISPKTVQHHVAHVYAETGVTNRTAAALFATLHSLLDHLPTA